MREASSWLRNALTSSLHARALELLPYQRIANAHMAPGPARVRSWAERMRDVRDVLAGSSLETLALWDLGASSRALEIAESQPQRSLRQRQIRASAALARREYDAAVELFQQLEVELPRDARNFQLRALALCLAETGGC